MEEKVKIYIPENVNNILLKDMERFEFFKVDGSFNKNEFYNTLIVNYNEQYSKQQSEFFNYIKKTILADSGIKEINANDMTTKILDYVSLKTNNLDQQKVDISLAIKPTKKSATDFDFIENYCLGNTSLSAYFRNMFASYVLLPQDKRERIIFKHNFELIEQAIKDKRKLYFTTTNNDAPHIVSPYSINNSKEELFNYLLADYKTFPYSFRVGRLRKLMVLNEPSEILTRNIAIFKRMEKQGPQYSYDINQTNSEIKVQLTERGRQMYKSFYLHRPQYTRIEDDYYYFECSAQQAYQYFNRFGRNALVIEPQTITEDLAKFYSSAARSYNKLLQKN